MASDPLNYLPNPDISNLKYAKLHSPKMKSVYWQYFGFPTNENDRIITKQSVVCTMCHKILTNHGNTTNLRAHLQHRHKELFHKICIKHNIRVPPRKKEQKNNTRKGYPTRSPTNLRSFKADNIKEELQDSCASVTSDDQVMLYETMVPMTYDDDEVIVSDNFAKVEVGNNEIIEIKTPVSQSNELDETTEVMNFTAVESKNESNNFCTLTSVEIDTLQLQDILVNMIVMDLRNIDTLYDPGMSQLVRALSSTMVLPSEKKIEALIKEQHSDKLTTVSDQIKLLSQMKPFSMGFDVWVNVENRNFLSIYYNYTTDAPNYSLLNQLYCTVEYTKYLSFEEILGEFNLQNCTAAIVNYDYDDYLKTFLKEKKIAVILSFDVTVDKCLKNVFALPAIVSVIEDIRDVIVRYSNEIIVNEVELPTIYDDFPWTFYDLLKFFSETMSWPDEMDMLVTSAKTIVDALNTLVITLDTLKGEEIPHSSMLCPITTKILNKKLMIIEEDDALMQTIKTCIITELERYVLDDDHLTIAALLDPRFHRLINITNYDSCVQILREKYNKLNASEDYVAVDPKKAIVRPNNSPPKKSNLELFFDIQETLEPTPAINTGSNLEVELKRYKNEVYVSLDESPFIWWNKAGYMYSSLKQVASLFQCVPCVLNMKFRKPIKDQISEHQRRYMLVGNLINAILFLHHESVNNNNT